MRLFEIYNFYNSFKTNTNSGEIEKNYSHTRAPKSTVAIPPPINPSHVFLGETLINGVRPKKKPKR